jgi:hypothetical protein
MPSTGKRPLSVAIPDKWDQAKDSLEYYLRRLFRESTNVYSNFFFRDTILDGEAIELGSLGPGVHTSTAPFYPYRNRRYLQLQASGYSALNGNQLLVTLYNSGNDSTDRIFDMALTGTAPGSPKSGRTSTVVNAGKDYVSTAQGWRLEVFAIGDWSSVTVEVSYEDFVPYV